MPWSESSAKTVTANAARHARLLRRAQTEPEKRLWWHLRHRLPVEGSHFRRQVPIEGYVADFCCLARSLIVEVDGDQHGLDAQVAYDARRTAALARCGYHVLRFSNVAVMREMDTVLDTIGAALADVAATTDISGATPTPDPSPQGGGEQEQP